MNDPELLQTLKQTAARIELQAIDFLDVAGRLSKRYTRIRLTFIDGTIIILPKRLEPQFSEQVFTLRPSRSDA